MRSNQYHTDTQIRDFVKQQVSTVYGNIFEFIPDAIVDRSHGDGHVRVAVLYKFPYRPIDPIMCANCGSEITPPLMYLRLGRYPACSVLCADTQGTPCP